MTSSIAYVLGYMIGTILGILVISFLFLFVWNTSIAHAINGNQITYGQSILICCLLHWFIERFNVQSTKE